MRNHRRRRARVKKSNYFKDGRAEVCLKAAREHNNNGAHIPEGHRDRDGKTRLPHAHRVINEDPPRVAVCANPILGVAHHGAHEELVVLEG